MSPSLPGAEPSGGLSPLPLLPPVLEVHVVWHPGDPLGAEVAGSLLRHFRTDGFRGLAGGAVEVYRRSEGWTRPGGPPRPISFPGALPGALLGASPGAGGPAARFVAVVPVLGQAIAEAAMDDPEGWGAYLAAIAAAGRGSGATPGRVRCFPVPADDGVLRGPPLDALFGRHQALARPDRAAPPEPPPEPFDGLLRRDLTQGLAQFVRGGAAGRTTVFLSHTKHALDGSEDETAALIGALRDLIAGTRLGLFFDASDLQPGEDFEAHLREAAGGSAMLALRTDLYASRDWCQREVMLAKAAGAAIVVLDALTLGEERGSFLLDHLPRAAVRREAGAWRVADLRRGLGLLVDECLRRALWDEQRRMVEETGARVAHWWAPHAPEPATLALWLETARPPREPLRILHPEPPLGREERAALDRIARMAGYPGLDCLTPRALAAMPAAAA